MFAKKTAAILLILSLIVITAAWSKLRFIDESDHEPQRWRADEHPAFKQQKDV